MTYAVVIEIDKDIDLDKLRIIVEDGLWSAGYGQFKEVTVTVKS